MAKKVYNKIRRVREFLVWFASKYPQTCHFCGEPIKTENITKGNSDDGLTIHHVDQNRDNNTPENLVICHRSCHLSYHRNNPVVPNELERAFHETEA